MFRIIPEGLSYKENVILKDGQGVLFRPAFPEDKERVKSFMKRVSRESLRMRFMAAISEVPETVIDELCKGDFRSQGCLLALVGEGEEEKVVGLGNYAGTGNGRSAEVAFLIEDDYQGKGISTLLLERLAGLAAANGYIEFEAEVLPDNQPMINVFKHSGFQNHHVWHSDTVHIELPVSGSKATWEKAALRERIATAKSLVPLLRPKVIAVVGASRDPESIGHLIFKNILNAGFRGTIYPVNPQADSVNGVKAYSSLSKIPDKIDLVVISVPAETVQEVAENAAKVGAKALLVVSAGFAEAGQEGAERQKKLVELIHKHGIRLLGPSCLGVMNTSLDIRLNASLAPSLALKGNAGFFSHSAALGLVIMEYAKEKGIGFTTFVSAGNRADVSGNDLLQYWEEDPDTKMAILYLETFGNPRKFVRIAREMTYKKPILCVKSARSSAGKKTAEAKTGISTGGATEIEALFHQTGVILADSLEELFDVALVISHQPLPEGNKVCIIANSAGMATIFADSCEANGLEIANEGLVNLGAFTQANNYYEAVKKALLNDDVHSLLVGYACVGNCGTEDVSSAIRKAVAEAEKESKIKKPVLLCLMGEVGSISLVEEENSDGERMFPAFRFPELAAKALGRIARYVNYKNKPAGKLVWYEDVQADKARILVQEILKNNEGKDEVEVDCQSAQKILSYFGFNFKSDLEEKDKLAIIEVKPDKLFGPLIQVKREDKKVLRITPLTDRDIDEIQLELTASNRATIAQTLGRISQMIEELPWLWKLELKAFQDENSLLHTDDCSMIIKPGGAKRPVY